MLKTKINGFNGDIHVTKSEGCRLSILPDEQSEFYARNQQDQSALDERVKVFNLDDGEPAGQALERTTTSVLELQGSVNWPG